MYQQHHTAKELAEMLCDARDPATPPERLRAIVQSKAGDAKDYPLREAVTANPNAPADLLINLAAYHPAAFCRNPAASLYLLERPDFLRRMPQKRGLLRCAEPPALFLEALSWHGDREMRDEVGMHVAVAGEVPDAGWVDALRDHWRGWTARRSRSDRVGRAELVALDIAPAWSGNARIAEKVRAGLLRASDPATAPDELEGLWALTGATPELRGVLVGERFRQIRAWRARGATTALLHLALSLNPSLPSRTGADGGPQCPYVNVLYPPARSVEHLIARHLPDYPRTPEASAPPARPDTQGRIWRVLRDAAGHVGRGAGHAFCEFAVRVGPDRSPAPAAQAQRAARSNHWRERLNAVFDLQPRHRRSAEALEALTGDGNRLVRAAAKARLRGAAFTWEDGT